MSVKTKLSFMISFIVLLLLVLNVILNEYSTRVNLRSDVESTLIRTGEQIAAAVLQNSQGYQMLEQALENKLTTALAAAARQLNDQAAEVSDDDLVLLASELGVTDITLLVRQGQDDRYVVRHSSRKETIGSAMDVPAKRAEDRDSDNGTALGGMFRFWSSPSEASAENPGYTDKRSFLADPKRDYILSSSIHDREAGAYGQTTGPDTFISVMKVSNPAILDIAGFNPALFRANIAFEANTYRAFSFVDMNKRPVLFGAYNYRELDKDLTLMKEAAEQGQPLFQDAYLNGFDVINAYLPVKKPLPYVIRVVLDKKPMLQLVEEQRNNQIFISCLLLVVLVLCSYWLSDILIRPIRMILWKVNEVSFGRFDSAIEINRKDELGQLGQRVNAMSKNLSVYMTKLKLAFEENRSMKEYLESFINHTTDAIHVVDLEGRIIQVNRAFEQLFGYTSDEAIGRALALVPEQVKQDEQEAMEWLKSGKLLLARETMRVTKSGELINVSVTTSPIRDKNGSIRAIASITRDMTSRIEMEELLRRSEKLTTVGQLAAGVAHEIRNPLTTLRGFIQLQKQNGKLNTGHIDIMLSELDRINLIVSEFLILAKPQATRFEVKDVRFVFGDVISLLDSQAHLCDIEFVTTFTAEPCLISCEENQLKQVFINVLKNAIEAMPAGGHIAIAIERNHRGQVSVSITDQGIGIPEDMISKIGDPFFTGKETGTGLGIMVSQRIIQSHQGTMDISSRVNIGTTVTIRIPLATGYYGTEDVQLPNGA